VKRIIAMLMVVLGRGTGGERSGGGGSSAEELGTGRRSRRRVPRRGARPRDLAAEGVAEMIRGLPPEVPRESALRIVQGTLAAAGVEASSLEGYTRARISELSSEVGDARQRQKEFQEQTEEEVRSLEGEIRRVREDCETILTEEERKISEACGVLEEMRRVRAFFGFPETNGEEEEEGAAVRSGGQEDTQPLGVLGS
jgi:hypothetical protein